MTKPLPHWFHTATRTLGALALLVVGGVHYQQYYRLLLRHPDDRPSVFGAPPLHLGVRQTSRFRGIAW